MTSAGATTLGAGAVAAASTFPAPYVKAQGPIRWRLQTYAGPALAEHVIKKSIDAFNTVANGEMEIELFYADQIVPTMALVPPGWERPNFKASATFLSCPLESTFFRSTPLPCCAA